MLEWDRTVVVSKQPRLRRATPALPDPPPSMVVSPCCRWCHTVTPPQPTLAVSLLHPPKASEGMLRTIFNVVS
jgi:hypothetical protein